MKALTCLKYLLLIAFGATLFFSCSDDEFGEDDFETLETTTIDKRNVKDVYDFNSNEGASSMAPECEIEICVVITPNITNNYPDIYQVTLPSGGIIRVQSGIVTLPNGTTQPLVNNEFCADIMVPVGSSLIAELLFKGYGAAVTTGTWPDGTSCEIFSAGVGTTAGILLIVEVELECDAPCAATDCTIEICAVITPNITNNYPDIYQVTLPGGGIIKIQNGIVTLPNGATQPLVNNEFCADIDVPVGSTLTAELLFKGYGAVQTTGTWPDGTSCLLFSAGVGTTAGILLIEEVDLECDAPCSATDCTIEICAVITPNTTNNYPDIYQVTLPGGGIIKIQNGIVTLPNGATQPLVNNEFCADIVVPVGSTLTAELLFKGYGAVQTTGTWPDGTDCLLFSAGVGTTQGILLIEEVDLECDAPC